MIPNTYAAERTALLIVAAFIFVILRERTRIRGPYRAAANLS